MARETRSEGTGKAPYSAPALRLYGSVRDLTGDVSGAASDVPSGAYARNALVPGAWLGHCHPEATGPRDRRDTAQGQALTLVARARRVIQPIDLTEDPSCR